MKERTLIKASKTKSRRNVFNIKGMLHAIKDDWGKDSPIFLAITLIDKSQSMKYLYSRTNISAYYTFYLIFPCNKIKIKRRRYFELLLYS